MKIEIKHRDTDAVLYTHEQDGNTVALTLLAAIRDKAALRLANLSESWHL